MPTDEIIGDANQLQELGIVRIVLIGDGQRFGGKRGFAAHQVAAGDAAQCVPSVGIARQRRIVGNDRLVGLPHLEQGVTGGDKRRDRGGIARGGAAVSRHRCGEIAAGLGRSADTHQCGIIERPPDAVTVHAERV